MFIKSLPAVIGLALAGAALTTTGATADPFHYESRDFVKKHCAEKGGVYADEPSGAYSCTMVKDHLATNCNAAGQCALVDTLRPYTGDNASPRGDGKKK